jgi:hypothetical protein
MSVLHDFKLKFANIISENDLLMESVQVELKPLTAKQAIGLPDRQDFPLQKGKERILEARFKDGAGQAFTDSFREYQGTIADLIELDLDDCFNASVFCAAANAVLSQLGLIKGTVHCRDGEPAQCAPMLVDYLAEKHPEAKRVAMVGLQPAMSEALSSHYEVNVLDLDPDNIGQNMAGALIRDGRTDLAQVAAKSDLVLATGSTLCNGTIDTIIAAADGRPVVFFGITIAGAAHLLGLERYCPLGH